MTRYLRIAAVFIALILLWFGGSVQAQEGQPEWPAYIVQAGDTLSSISLRFDIAAEEIVQANNLANPNQLFEGQRLVLPGIDWVEGVLDTRQIPYGENLRSLTRRYQVSGSALARLNRASSPAQLYAGYPLLVPTERGEDLESARALLAPQESLLEVAAASGANPWVLAGVNRLGGTWEAIPGDVLLTPGVSQAGPGAVPSPVTDIQFSPAEFVQGRTTVLRVSVEGEMALAGELLGRKVTFFSEAPGSYVALQGVHAMTDPGVYPFTLRGTLADGTGFEFSQSVRVNSGGYGFETLSVPPEFLDPELNETEFEQVLALVAESTPEKMWQGFFQAPTPYGDTINSSFGTRRSYNDGAYEYFHSGVDFGGGTGVQIFAPAQGVVVFAGPLEVRGNATVINHGWGVYTGYWHQSEINVQVGDVVQPGQVIGLVGATGRVSGAHLHWELWIAGVQVNPLEWLDQVFP